jgi:CRP-like cAMP-binding protein
MKPLPRRNEKRLNHGELLFMQGDPGESLFLVTEGKLRIFVRDGAQNIELGHIETGEILGEMALLDPAPRAASAQAVGLCTVIEIGGEDLKAQMEAAPNWFTSLIRVLTQRLREMNERQVLADQKAAVPCIWNVIHQMDPSGQLQIPMNAIAREVHHLTGMSQTNLTRLIKKLHPIAWTLQGENIHCPQAGEWAEKWCEGDTIWISKIQNHLQTK